MQAPTHVKNEDNFILRHLGGRKMVSRRDSNHEGSSLLVNLLVCGTWNYPKEMREMAL